jgi:hypothetical protein
VVTDLDLLHEPLEQRQRVGWHARDDGRLAEDRVLTVARLR